MWSGFSTQKLKPQLKMATSRIQIASNKKAALLKQTMREIAVILAEDPPKEEKAKIRAEALIRDDNLIEAYEILQLECELLHERIKLIEFSKECPPDLVPVVATLMWAAHRVDIPELLLIRKQFRAKYGKQFEEDAIKNKDGRLNERVVSKLSVEPPAAYLVQTYLERICEQYQVSWTPKVKLSTNEMIEPMAAPVGYSVSVAQGTGLGPVSLEQAMTGEESKSFSENGGIPPPYKPIPPPTSSSNNIHSMPKQPTAPGGPATLHGGNDFAEVDIFVPGAPSAPPGSVAPSSLGSPGASSTGGGGGGGEDKKDDDDDNNIPPAAPTGGAGGGATYEDLAARFDQLRK